MIQNVLTNNIDSSLQKTGTSQLENQLKKNYTNSSDDELGNKQEKVNLLY